MPDAVFEEPRLAAIYDALDPDRSDLDAYVAMIDEFGAQSILDLGCGTGVLALLLAERGIQVIGVDPAGASLDVARGKAGAELVTWIHGDASAIPESTEVDAVTMTANVAQVFLADADWLATLQAAHRALPPGGRLIFESRDPDRQAWVEWTEGRTRSTTDIPGVGSVTNWIKMTEIDGQLVTFESPNVFEADGTVTRAGSRLTRFVTHRTARVVSSSSSRAGSTRRPRRARGRRRAPQRYGRPYRG